MDDEKAVVAAELSQLSKLSQFSGRADDLKSLADEVVNDKADTWVGINLVSAFPAGTTGEPRQAHFFERWLSYIATAVIFLPIAWTWFSFRAASAAFRDMLERDAVGQNTFLSLWATGFDGELAWYHHLAVVAVVSLVIIIGAALFVVAQRAVVYRNQKDETAKYARLVAALVGAQRLLNQRTSEDADSIRGVIRRAVMDLREMNDQTQQAASNLKTATGELTATVTSSLKPAMDSLTLLVAELSGVRAEADQALSRFAAQAADQAKAFRVDVKEVLVEAEAAHGEFIRSAEGATTTVAAAVGTLSREQKALADAVTALGTEQHQLAEAVKVLPEGSRSAAEPLITAVADFNAKLQEWRTTLEDHSHDLSAYANTTQKEINEVNRTVDGTRRMLVEFFDIYSARTTNGSGNGGSPA